MGENVVVRCDSCGDSSPTGGTWRTLTKTVDHYKWTINLCGHCDANELIQRLQDWEPNGPTHYVETGWV